MKLLDINKYLFMTEKFGIIEVLLKAGADVNTRDRYSNTLMMKAMKSGGKVIEILLRYGADANTANSYGITILMTAVKDQDSEKIRMLLNYGANAYIRNRSGHTAIDMAERICHERWERYGGYDDRIVRILEKRA